MFSSNITAIALKANGNIRYKVKVLFIIADKTRIAPVQTDTHHTQENKLSKNNPSLNLSLILKKISKGPSSFTKIEDIRQVANPNIITSR